MNTDTLTPPSARPPAHPATSRATVVGWRRAAIATGTTAAANLAIYVVSAAAGVDFTLAYAAGADPTTVTAGHVLISSLVALAIGFGLAGLVARRWSRGRAVVRVLGGVVAVVSAVMPLGVVAATATRLVLASLHLVVGAAFVAALAPDVEA